ncbi:MAG: hypothetical protein JWO80_3308, partial [Bryobacterales bacterium]|nr:hypothetical protein [Bryobacterales bacterium]
MHLCAALVGAGQVQCIERVELEFFELPRAIRLGALRNDDSVAN